MTRRRFTNNCKVRSIKDYESVSRDELLSIIFPSKKEKQAKKGKKNKNKFF